MKEKIVDRLVSVKSIVTVTLTVMFAILCYQGKLDQNFMVVYTAVITFYFAKKDTASGDSGAETDLTAGAQPPEANSIYIKLPKDKEEEIASMLADLELKPGDEDPHRGDGE